MDHIQELELFFELRDTPEQSRESYLRRAEAFVKFIEAQGRSVEDVSTQDIQQYILHLKRNKRLSAGTINNYISSVRLFYTHVLGKEWDTRKLPRMRRTRKLAVIPPREDVMAILDATENLKHKAMLSLLYGSGLRVSEVAKLRIGDISSKNMSVRAEATKHGTNRYTILSAESLKVLRSYFRVHFSLRDYTPHDWLFPGREPGEHVNVKTIKNIIMNLRNQLNLDSRISAHTLRHCFATHLLEDGVDPIHIQHLLGHKHFSTTADYLHLASRSLMGVKSPLDSR